MQSEVARRLMRGTMIVLGLTVLLTGLAAAIQGFGHCSGGRYFMAPSPMQSPVTCTRLPDGLGEVADWWLHMIANAIFLSPLIVIALALIIGLPEISERNRRKRARHAADRKE